MRRALFVMLLLALPIAGPVTAAAQEPAAATTPTFESLLPGDTFFVASMPNVPSMCDQLDRTALGQLLAEPEVKQFLKPGLDWLSKQMARHQKRNKGIGISISEFLGLFQGQVGAAVISFDPMMGGMIPDAVLYMDAGSKKAELNKLIHQCLDKAGAKVRVRQMEKNGQKWLEITGPGTIVLSAGFFGNALVVATRPDRMPKLVDAYQNGLEGNITQNPNFKAATAKVGASNSFFYGFANVEAILGHFGDRLPPQATMVLKASGLGDVKAIAMGSSCVAEGVRDSMFVYVPGEKHGLLKMFYTAPSGKMDLFDRVPESAFWTEGVHMDPNKLIDILVEMADSVYPGAGQQIEMGLSQGKQMLGVDIREGLLKPLGNQFAFYACLPKGGGFIPDIVMLAKLDDAATFEKSLTTLIQTGAQMAGGMTGYQAELRTMDFMGKKIYYLNVESRRHQDPFPVTPSFVIDGNVAAIALFPQPLKEFIARGEDAPSIAARPDFARVMKGLPGGMTALEYVDLGAAFRWVYGTLVPIYQAVGKNKISPFDPALVPRTETVAKHLFGAAWGVKAGKDGIAFHGYSQVGMLPLFMGGMAAGLLVARSEQRGMMRVRRAEATPHTARPVSPPVKPTPMKPTTGNPRAQLKEIYIALLYQFAETNDYPADLGALVKSKALESADALLLPGDPAPMTAGSGLKTSFAYVGPKVGSLKENSDKAVWVYERDGLSKDGRWVLFADGSVRRVPEDQFQGLLAGTRKMIAK